MNQFAHHTIHLTTPLALFTLTKLADMDPDMLHWMAEQYAQTNNANVTIYRGGECVTHYDHHEDKIIPAIWTHTPVPVGFDIQALKDKFEERAASVLSDYDSDMSQAFVLCTNMNVHKFNDNRYFFSTIRMAWMMYVDQAIEHFNSK